MSRPSRAVALLAALAAAACGKAADRPAGAPAASAPAPAEGDTLRGLVLQQPKPKADFTLTDTDGKPFEFRRQTDGYVTLLFFGYTNCPDVCPVHMANLGQVVKQLPPSVTERLRIVFATTDPARDTPPVIRRWLDHFDTSFIGLTGSEADVVAAQVAMGMPPAQREQPDTTAKRSRGTKPDSTGYTVGHAAFVLAFTADGMLRVLYPFGIRQADWAHDLPILVRMGAPAS